MKTVNALALRQSLGKALEALEATGEPILLERGRRAVGVIISLRDYQERFAEKAASDARRALFAEIRAMVRPSAGETKGLEMLRELRRRG